MSHAPTTVLGVLAAIFRRPDQYLIRYWNWKSALMSVLMRSIIFFSTTVKFGWKAGLAAVTHDIWYRFFLSGTIGSLTQAFRKAEPAWLATITVSILLPAFAHLVEYVAHKLQGTQNLKTAVTASIIFTVISILFNYYIMRRGVLVVDEGSRSFWSDMAQMPRMILGFLLVIPRALMGKKQPG